MSLIEWLHLCSSTHRSWLRGWNSIQETPRVIVKGADRLDTAIIISVSIGRGGFFLFLWCRESKGSLRATRIPQVAVHDLDLFLLRETLISEIKGLWSFCWWEHKGSRDWHLWRVFLGSLFDSWGRTISRGTRSSETKPFCVYVLH